MSQGNKVEQRIRELFFLPWLLLTAGFFQGSGKAAKPLRTKEENHKRVADAPLLRFSPFEIPFPYLPPRVRSTWEKIIGFLLSAQRAEDRYGEQIYCLHQKASFVTLPTKPYLSH